MWEVLWGGVGLAPVLWSSPAHLLLISSLPALLIPWSWGSLLSLCSSSFPVLLCSCGVASPLLAPDLMPWWWCGGYI